MTLNINIPKTDNSTFQPDFTRSVEYSGFTFFHSLKERYYIKPSISQPNITTTSETLLNGKSNGFAYLIGGNSNSIYIVQPNEGQLAKVQVNPGTGNVIAESIIDIRNEVRTFYSNNALEVFITSGLVKGTTIILGGCTNNLSVNDMNPIVLITDDNALSWTIHEVDYSSRPIQNRRGTIISIVEVFVYAKVYYWFLLRAQNINVYDQYLISETNLLDSPAQDITFHQTINTPHTFFDPQRFYINIQAKFQANSIYFLNDNRTRYYELLTNLESGDIASYTNVDNAPAFQQSVSTALTTSKYTHIKRIKNNNDLSFNILKLDELITNSSTPTNTETINYGYYTLWNRLDSTSTRIGSGTITNIKPYSTDILVLGFNTSSDLVVKRGGFFNTNTAEDLVLDLVPLNRYNTGSNFITAGVVVDPLPAGWLANNSISSWLSDRADTATHNYGASDVDYLIDFTAAIPFATSIIVRIQYYGQVLDVEVNNVSQGITLSGSEGTWIDITLNLDRGINDISISMRNPAGGGPTGVRLEFYNDLDLDLASGPSEAYSDIFVDEPNDKFYISYNTYAWVCTLSTFTIDYVMDLHAEPFTIDPPYPEGYDPLIDNGVDDSVNIPLDWRFLKYFNKIYIYNTKHDTTFINSLNKKFYMWEVNNSIVPGHFLFSSFNLNGGQLAKVVYFYNINNQLHIIASRRTGTGSTGVNTYQYRVSGLALFTQLTGDPVLVGNNLDFNDVFVNKEGEIFVSASDGNTNFSQPNTALFVRKNTVNTGGGTYIIPVDATSGPFNYEGFTPITLPGYTPDNFGLSMKYIEVPGDYRGRMILNSNIYRRDNYSDVKDYADTLFLGSGKNTTAVLPPSNIILVGEIDPAYEWLYCATYDNNTSTYKLYRVRSVFYPVINP